MHVSIPPCKCLHASNTHKSCSTSVCCHVSANMDLHACSVHIQFINLFFCVYTVECVSICVSVCVCIRMCVTLTYISIYIYLRIYLSIFYFFLLFIFLSLLIYLYLHLFICLRVFACLNACVQLYLSLDFFLPVCAGIHFYMYVIYLHNNSHTNST